MILFLVANIALSYSPNFTVLLLFRGVQSGGSASTLILARNFSIAVGPVMGGALAQGFGFRSIFVFLLIGTAILLVAVVFFSTRDPTNHRRQRVLPAQRRLPALDTQVQGARVHD
ncbi:major facilitator superfamily transporter [Apiospora phragmitis]|uniref:Major facilitator superfamily transporter n=1 Tax=Apiospora phragmitis TaxID=2905665 RepID=A0ABR1T622_9PEZI